MKKKRLSPILYIALVIVIAVFFVRHFYIRDFRTIAPDVLYTSAQPRGMDYTRLLYKYHIAAIVNVRSASEHREKNWHNEELTWIKENAVKYVELPISKLNYFPDSQVQEKFLSLMKSPDNLPVLLHGSVNDKRVAMLVAVWLRAEKKLSSADTVAQIKKILDERPITEEDVKFVDSLKEQ
jgi:protein tyrosine/serine phosphatase